MNVLGNLGSLYMLILIILLIISFGLAGWRFITYIFDDLQQPTKSKNVEVSINKIDVFKWIHIAVMSFIGVLLSIMILVIVKPS